MTEQTGDNLKDLQKLVERSVATEDDFYIPEKLSSEEDVRKRIFEVYFHAKAVVLAIEEIDSRQATVLQPMQEQRNALDHIARAEGVRLGVEGVTLQEVIEDLPARLDNEELKNVTDDYIARNYDKALGHVYRAFFDAADIYGLILKEKIECIIDKYAAAVINTICPHYYTQLVDRIAEAQEGIAEARRTKDVTTHKYGTQIEKYREELGGLEDVLRLLKRREGDFAKEKRRAFIRLYAVPFIVGVAVALVGVGLTMWIGDSRNASTESPPFHAQPGPPAPGSTPPPGPPPTP